MGRDCLASYSDGRPKPLGVCPRTEFAMNAPIGLVAAVSDAMERRAGVHKGV